MFLLYVFIALSPKHFNDFRDLMIVNFYNYCIFLLELFIFGIMRIIDGNSIELKMLDYYELRIDKITFELLT